MFDAVLAEFAVVRARTTEELLDIAQTATRRIYPARNTLGVFTISGGAGALIADAAAALGLEMPPMPEAAQARLRALLPFATPRNPVDCTGQAFNDLALIGQFAETMVADGGYTSVLAVLQPDRRRPPSITPGAARAVAGGHGEISRPASMRSRCWPRRRRFSGSRRTRFVVFEEPTRADGGACTRWAASARSSPACGRRAAVRWRPSCCLRRRRDEAPGEGAARRFRHCLRPRAASPLSARGRGGGGRGARLARRHENPVAGHFAQYPKSAACCWM